MSIIQSIPQSIRGVTVDILTPLSLRAEVTFINLAPHYVSSANRIVYGRDRKANYPSLINIVIIADSKQLRAPLARSLAQDKGSGTFDDGGKISETLNDNERISALASRARVS